MKFNLTYSKIGNFFFFVSNLSVWNYHCRKDYNELWLKNSPLNEEEKKALDKLRSVFQEKKYELINPSLTSKDEKEFWSNVSKIVPREQLRVFTESFNVFSARFGKIWAKEEINLKKIKNNAVEFFSISDGLVNLIKTLYEVKNSIKLANIFLFINPIKEHFIGGGSGFGQKGIGIECSKITEKNNRNNLLIRVILHEITHAYFEKKLIDKINRFIPSEYFKNKYQSFILKSRIYGETKSILGPIKELILVSLLPEGYLAEKYFELDVIKNLKRKKRIKEKKLERNYYDLMTFGIFRLYNLAKNYSDNKQPINKNYIEEAVKCWEEFENTNLKTLKI